LTLVVPCLNSLPPLLGSFLIRPFLVPTTNTTKNDGHPVLSHSSTSRFGSFLHPPPPMKTFRDIPLMPSFSLALSIIRLRNQAFSVLLVLEIPVRFAAHQATVLCFFLVSFRIPAGHRFSLAVLLSPMDCLISDL